MTIREPECVALKRRGAEYVGQLLAGKSKQEELEFWDKRTVKVYVLGKSRKHRNLSRLSSSKPLYLRHSSSNGCREKTAEGSDRNLASSL